MLIIESNIPVYENKGGIRPPDALTEALLEAFRAMTPGDSLLLSPELFVKVTGKNKILGEDAKTQVERLRNRLNLICKRDEFQGQKFVTRTEPEVPGAVRIWRMK